VLDVSENVLEGNAGNWGEEILKSKELVVVEFWHPQCPFCKVIDPIFAELAAEYAGRLKFVKFNVLESPQNREIGIKYGIMGTPTLKFFCGGKPVQDIMGALTKDYLRQGIEFAIKKHRECSERSTPLNLSYIS